MQANAEPLRLPAQPLWERVLETVRSEGKTYAHSLLIQMKPLGVRNGIFMLGVPDRFIGDWLDDHYRSLLEEMIAKAAGTPIQIGYEVLEGLPALPLRPNRLNDRFTFNTFVVADSNQLPAAGAAAVAENPGRCYNPLFIYGGTGLGKTHLLHAVGNEIFARTPLTRIIYLTSEEFTNEYINSVRDHRMPEFRQKFREECDVLLIDDIQILGKKEETQKEFFHTFNALHEKSRAIIITCDTAPSEVPGLEDRLRSRFTMGLITDIQEPDLETRVAILKKKAQLEGLEMPDQVCHFIARHIQKNVRELEGALIKISAMFSITGQAITEEFAAQTLKDILPTNRPLDIDLILRETARFYKLAVEDLRVDRRTKHLAHARQVAMYLCRKLTKSSFPEIGTKFNKDHSTVISAVRKVESLRESESSVHREITELEAKLGAPAVSL